MSLRHRMVSIAAARGQVVVTEHDRSRLATLIAWKDSTARVEFLSGGRATVKHHAVSEVNP